MKRFIALAGAVVSILAGLLTANVPSAQATAAPSISVSGGRFVDGSGAAIQLHGVNRSGAEYACAEGWGIFDGETDTDAAVAAMLAWNINAVRIPLNEDCWLGINGVAAAYSGRNYQNAIISYINRLNAAGIVAIPNLHFSAPGTTLATDQMPMADADHAPAFWTSAAQAFNNQPTSLGQDDPVTQPHSIVFDLFNEPSPPGGDSNANWQCIMQGSGTCGGSSYAVASMQSMLDAVRATGAIQPVLTAGPDYAGDLDKWLANPVADSLNQVAASVHIYGLPLDSPLRTTYSTEIPPVAAQVPVVVGEFGDTNCTDGFTTPFLDWAWPGNTNGTNVSTIAWAFNTASCANDPSLISGSYTNPTPTAYGIGVKNKYLLLPVFGSGASQAPAVTTGAATGITSSGATLNGTVNPEGQASTYQFEYGTTTGYGSVSPATPGSAGSGSSPVPESAALSGLAASTTYHYRLNATNATGTTHGSDQQFTTAASGGGVCPVSEDASMPPVRHSGYGVASVTTASFSPPAASLLEVEVNALQASIGSGLTVTVTDSAGDTFTAGPHLYGTAAPNSVWLFQSYLPAGHTGLTVVLDINHGGAVDAARGVQCLGKLVVGPARDDPCPEAGRVGRQIHR